MDTILLASLFNMVSREFSEHSALMSSRAGEEGKVWKEQEEDV